MNYYVGNAQLVHVAARLATTRSRRAGRGAAILVEAQISREPVSIVRVKILADPRGRAVLAQLDTAIDHRPWNQPMVPMTYA